MQLRKLLVPIIQSLTFTFLLFNNCLSSPVADTIFAQAIPEPQINFSPKHYISYKTDGEININGKLDEVNWQQAEWTELFSDIEGNLKSSPRFKTKVKMLWDNKYFYIAAQLEEPDVWGTLKMRDTVIYRDNDFEVFIDPDGDTHNYYEFEMNALNTVWDLLIIKPYRLGGPPVNAWDIQGLLTGVHIDGTLNNPNDKDKGWTVELAFPWEVLLQCSGQKTLPVTGDQWRINFSRVEWQTEAINGSYKKKINPATGYNFPEDNWVWSPQGIIDMHFPEMWGYVQFSEKNAGKGKDEFIHRQEEDAKWICRQIFYKESEYYSRHGEYIVNPKELGLNISAIPGYQWPPEIKVIPDYFEVIMTPIKEGKKVHIASDGRTW